MRVLIVNRFFGGGQIPTGRMAEDVARVLLEAGHDVVALASSGEYAGAVSQAREQAARRLGDDAPAQLPLQKTQSRQGALAVETLKVPKWMPRAMAWPWFTWQARKRIPRMDWEVCVLMTDPPLLPLLAPRAKVAEGPLDVTRRVVVWLMDLYPEALAASGRIKKSGLLYRWHFNKRQRALRACDMLICLGEGQKERLGSVLTEEVRTAVVPPWDNRANIGLAREHSLQNVALYAGNLGEAHCFEEILAAAPHLPGDWTIRFAARGAKLRTLKEKANTLSHGSTCVEGRTRLFGCADRTGGKCPSPETPGFYGASSQKDPKSAGARVEITGYASAEETPGLLASARVHLITMSPGWEGIVVPSKLHGCIRTGRPVLFVGPENSDTASQIRAHDWGSVLPPGVSGEDVASAIVELAARPTKAVRSQQGAAEIAELLVVTGGLQDDGTAVRTQACCPVNHFSDSPVIP